MTSVALREVASVVRGVSFDKSDVADSPEDGLVPILRAGNIDGELNLIDDLVWVPGGRVSEEQRMRAADIAICMSSGSLSVVGKTAALRHDWSGSVGAFCAIIRPDAGRIEPDFLAFFLKSETFRVWTRQSSGANIKNIRKTELEAFEFNLPSLPEQQRIVDLLSRAEGIVRLRREAQRKAAELVPALFLDMFGDPASNPKGWPVRRIDELVERFEGGKNVQAGDEGSATYRILKISAVTSGRYIESESKPAPSDLVPAESHFIRTGDLLISRANTEALVGATAVVEITDGRTLLPDKLWRFVWRGDATIEPRFALHLLQQPAMRNKLSQLASGTGGSMKNISQAKLKTLELPVPPVELQREFAAKADAIRAIAARQATALATAQATFDALLHQAFAARQPG